MTELEIRDITTFDEIDACIELQRTTWSLPDVDLTPSRLFVMARYAGTPPIGAFDGTGRLIGFLHMLPARFEGVDAIYSHMLAVEPAYRDRGVGHALKLEQRRRALAAGTRLVVWTFDPLQSRNAHLNVNRLGAIIRRYVVDFYGARHASVFDAGIGSDRVFAEWWVASEHVRRTLDGGRRATSSSAATVAIPLDLGAIKAGSAEAALYWRRRTRLAFQSHLARGLAATALERDPAARESRYVFEPIGVHRDAIG